MHKSGWLALAGLMLALPAVAADPVRTERVQFAHGASAATLTGSVRGYASVEYKIGVRAGQTLTAHLKTSNASNYFNVVGPGAAEAAFVGSTSGNDCKLVLPTGGDWTIQVYLMRSAARRNETATYTLTVGVTG